VSVTRLPSGRRRAQVYDASTGKNVSVSAILGGQGTFATKSEAKRAREQARERLGSARSREVTVRAFWERWTTDPLFARPKRSSGIRRRELTKAFVDHYGDIPLVQVGDEIVADWLAGGKRAGSVQGLCSMFNDAASVKAGRLIDRNPFQKLGISRGKGRRDQQPPSEQQVWQMIGYARNLACPSFAAWLQVAAFTGMRPGELDALRWERVDFDRHRIVVAEQFNAATRTFDTPKNHLRREAPLTAHARDSLLGLARESEFCFVSLRSEHWTPSSRAYHWKAVRAAAGWNGSLYLATRHFAGWYMVNELEMPSEDVAIALGHQDGGNLVRRLYGHRDNGRALDRIIGAYATRAENRRPPPRSSPVGQHGSPQESLF
jgi:integrase